MIASSSAVVAVRLLALPSARFTKPASAITPPSPSLSARITSVRYLIETINVTDQKTIDITHAKNIKISIGQGLADSQSSSGSSGSSGGSTGTSGQSNPGKDAKAGPDKDVTMVFTENDITITKGKGVVKQTANNITLTFDDSVVTIESGKITHKAKNVVIDSPKIQLGGAGASTPVKLCDDSCATTTFAV